MMNTDANHILDTTGLKCPEPVMLLHKVVREASSGESIKVIATDPSTQRDVPQFCQFLGHDLVESWATDSTFEFVVRKA